MRFELHGEIVEACPVLFRNGLTYGFQCEDGWYKLIKKLSRDLEEINHSLPRDTEPIVVLQVKEKLGGLRFYVRNGNEKAYKLIRRAERKSFQTCELCGDPGMKRHIDWIRTLCDECHV